MKIAIIGTGISGLTVAHALAPRHDVTLFEKDATPGGHSNTVVVREHGRELGLDTGFIVYNERTYPNFTRLLAELGVATQDSEMTFGVECRRCGIAYCGRDPWGLFARPAQLFKPSHLRMLLEIVRFNREGVRELEMPGSPDHTLGRFLAERGYSSTFCNHYILPMGGAIWSSDLKTFEEFPLHYFLRFFQNHGLLTVNDHPRWRTVSGGSRRYVSAIVEKLRGRVALGCPVRRVYRRGAGVEIDLADDRRLAFDEVVIATHSDQALRLLADASAAEERALGAIRYQANEAVLHTDESMLPKRRLAWAAWNVRLNDCAARGAPLHMTYSLNHLQTLDSKTRYCVTLNDTGTIAPGRVLRKIAYEHPVYDFGTLEAQRMLKDLNGERHTYYGGAYLGFGFHEDGVVSALDVVRLLGERERAAA